MDILCPDWVAALSLSTVRHSQGIRSVAAALQLVEQIFIGFNWKEGGI